MIRYPRPCPFCGTGGEMLELSVVSQTAGKTAAQVKCNNCGAAGPVHWDAEGPQSLADGATYCWNDRF